MLLVLLFIDLRTSKQCFEIHFFLKHHIRLQRS